MTSRIMWLGGRGGVSNSCDAQWFPAPAVFDQLLGCLTLLRRPSLVTQNDNTQRELGFFSVKKKKKNKPHKNASCSISLLKGHGKGFDLPDMGSP